MDHLDCWANNLDNYRSPDKEYANKNHYSCFACCLSSLDRNTRFYYYKTEDKIKELTIKASYKPLVPGYLENYNPKLMIF